MARLDDCEPIFGKPGEVILVGLSGARICPRVENRNQQAQEAPHSMERGYSSSSSPRASDGQYSNAGSYQQAQPASHHGSGLYAPSTRATQEYANYSNQGGNQQLATTSNYTSSAQYPAIAPGFYESSTSSRY
ncbi:hypothetical protein G7Y89_g4733 [Cudoniella acicularis]|uniref:Uncharacterized protein n=1 Tax=Cudoniella acicularis TaxID=354080 RepID=A0A8H4RNV4_9HELO|nr:hypothetical protein G7Y89_g4733 [Cudoniella acicularis]